MLGGPDSAPACGGGGGGWRLRSGASDSGRRISDELSLGMPKIGCSSVES
jgi:hypothetical protein